MRAERNTEYQTPNTNQLPNSNLQAKALDNRSLWLVFEVWSLSGVWCLVFGVFPG
jgi:hypothetical protein